MLLRKRKNMPLGDIVPGELDFPLKQFNRNRENHRI